MSDFGLTPEQPEEAVAKIREAYISAITQSRPFVLKFDKGTYRIELGDSAKHIHGQDRYLFDIVGQKGVTIDGGGSEFLFTGVAGFARIAHCSDVVLRNFSIDWERPYITQAEVRSCGDDFIDLYIDAEQYPYHVVDGRMRYICADGEYGLEQDSYNNFFTPEGNILPGSVDNYWMCDMLNGPVEEMEDGVLRFRGPMQAKAPAGSLMTLYNVRYRTAWADMTGCDNVLLRDITVYHTTGIGVRATVCSDLTVDNVDYTPRRDKGRVFSGVADAFHLVNCDGCFVMRNCDVDGQGDDALNVHGSYCRVDSLSEGGRRLYFKAPPGVALNKVGESLWLIDETTMQRSREYAIEWAGLVDGNLFAVHLSESPGIEFNDRLFVESASLYPDVLIEHNRFGRANRARGILLTSPGKMVVRDNVFESSGTAILVEGDLTYWYESGAVRDLTIKDNYFDRCHTSQWGHSVIAFSPSPVPEDDSLPRYHTGVSITGNRFDLIEPSVLYARNVGGLEFKDNDIKVVGGYPPVGNMQSPVVLEHCTDCLTEY